MKFILTIICCMMSYQSFAILVGDFFWKEQMKADNIYIVRVKEVDNQFKSTGDMNRDRERYSKGVDVPAICSVLKTFKGNKYKTITITYITAITDSRQKLVKNKIYMVFLKNKGGKLIPVQPYQSFVLLPSYIPLNQKLTPKQFLEYQAGTLLNSKSEKKMESAFVYYNKYKLNISQERFLELLKNSSENIKYNALLLLLKARNKEAVNKIDTMIKDNSFLKIPRGLRNFLTFELTAYPQVMISEEACIVLVSTNDEGLQYVGTYLLRKIGTAKCLPVLIKAIDSKDESTQQRAYVAISKITGNKHYYGTTLFKERKKEAIEDAKQRARKMISSPNAFKKKDDDYIPIKRMSL